MSKIDKGFFLRVVELVREDEELHQGVLDVLKSIENSNNAMAEYRRARIAIMGAKR